MMKNPLMLVLALNTLISFGQSNNTLLRPQNLVKIKNEPVILYSTDSTVFIQGQKFSTDARMINIQIDTAYHNLILICKYKKSAGYHEAVCYNLSSDSVLWRYRTLCQSSRILMDKTVLIYSEATTNSNKIFLLDRSNGEPKGFIEDVNIFRPVNKDLLFYTSSKSGFSNEFEIVNGKTFAIENKIKLPSDYFFSGYSIHDSCLYININGLYAFDNKYNKIWNCGLSTMQLDLKSVLFAIGLGVGVGILTGVAPIYSASNYLADLNSEFFFSNNDLIICDKENIHAFNKKTGEKIWIQKLPFKTGYSHLIPVTDSTTALLNTGLCIKNGMAQHFCEPYYSCFNNGDGIFVKSHVFNESDYISDFQCRQDTTIILSNNGISLVSINIC